MVDTNRPISAVKSEIITNIPCLHVTISIRKNCGEFALVLFNLEQKQVSVIIYVRFGIFRYCQHSMMMIWWTLQAIDHWLLNLSHWWCQLIWSICFVNCTIFKPFLFRVDTFIFVILIFPIHGPILFWNYFLSNWWIQPLEGGFLSIRVRCTRWSWWLYHCNVFSHRHGQ